MRARLGIRSQRIETAFVDRKTWSVPDFEQLRPEACSGSRMAAKDIVVIGASAGGLQALEQLGAGLPADLPASVFVVWHLAPGVKSVLPMVLNRASRIPAVYPNDGDAIEPGRIYVAPNDHHLLLERGYVRVAKG